MPRGWTINPDRGGTHKVLRRETGEASWARKHVALGTNTAPYRRAEGRYRLMPGMVAALAASGTPFSVLTKGTVLARDLPLLSEADQGGGRHVDFAGAAGGGAAGDPVAGNAEPEGPAGADPLNLGRGGCRAAGWWRRCCPIAPTALTSLRSWSAGWWTLGDRNQRDHAAPFGRLPGIGSSAGSGHTGRTWCRDTASSTRAVLRRPGVPGRGEAPVDRCRRRGRTDLPDRGPARHAR